MSSLGIYGYIFHSECARILGWSSLVGLSSIFISYAFLQVLAKRSLAITRHLLAATDRRISVVSELVGAIRFLKYYAWERVWVDKAIEAREKELSVRYRSNFNSAYLYLVLYAHIFRDQSLLRNPDKSHCRLITPSMITFTTFLCYTKVAKQELSIPGR